MLKDDAKIIVVGKVSILGSWTMEDNAKCSVFDVATFRS